ncbi:MobF family relaxase [Nonomuraea sp. SYSU D8015]|uniref:MobF family relaxase n=1 Tax=Nonomuraea sp. SYSU D8015 TaxID=2593644 RepID=UPI0016611BE4|nr:MobF family relaxase [Nonomuraea sp. SYSU D8015]
MSWITVIGPSDAQVEYRLAGLHGCGRAETGRIKAAPLIRAVQAKAAEMGVEAGDLLASDRQRHLFIDAARQVEAHGDDYEMNAGTALRIAVAAGLDLESIYPPSALEQVTGLDRQVAYRMADTERPLLWIGSGCQDLGITAGAELSAEEFDDARAIMKGIDPQTGEVLVAPKRAAHPRSKLTAAPLLEAIRDRAKILGVRLTGPFGSKRKWAAYSQMSRQVERLGDSHRVKIGTILTLADAAGVDVVAVYGRAALEEALKWEHETVVVGNRGYDLTLNLPKAFSVLWAFASDALGEQVEEVFLQAVQEAVQAAEEWTCYGLRHHHGDGQAAERVACTGFVGWLNVHRTARPVEGAPIGDPHLHAHVTVANLALGTDGRWSTIAAGGRDLFRHISAIDALLQARVRQLTHERWGMVWERNTRTGVWEIVGIPDETIRLFSKRNTEILALFEAWGIDIGQATAEQQHTAAEVLKQGKVREATESSTTALREYWRAEAQQAGQHPDRIMADVLAPSADPGSRPDALRASPHNLDELCAFVFRRDEGLTSHRKDFTRAQALAAVLDALPGGVTERQEAEDLTDLVLAHGGYAMPLAARGEAHLSNAARFTTADIVAAERAILATTRARYRSNTAVVAPATLAMAIDTYEMAHGLTLSAEQRAVLARITGAGHGVEAVIGVAGAGKTTLMEVARIAWEAEGKVVAGTSTAAVAASNLRVETGIRSFTIAGWLQRIRHRQGLAGVDVLIVDESAMVDDRQLAELLEHAAQVGTKVVGIGDPQQLQSPGVGGAFSAVHTLVDGLMLETNYRQKDPVERQALQMWRDGQRREALRLWAEHGRVHATATREESFAAMLALWDERRTLYPTIHDAIAGVLLLAGRNADVDELNVLARTIRRARGELHGQDVTFALANGGHLPLALGDIVLIRQNDYRERESKGRHADVLNGFRGIVVDVDRARGARVEWRRTDKDGREQFVREWVSPDYIASGGLSYGMAMTVHKTQGLGADYALTYGVGLHANAVYTALSRDIREAHLFQPRVELEDEAKQAERGMPRSLAEELDRALNAFADSLEHDRNEALVITELGDEIAPIDASQPGPRLRGDPMAGAIAAPDPLAEAVRAAAGPWGATLVLDPDWPVLAEALEEVIEAGGDPEEVLFAAAADSPLAGVRSLPRVLAWRVQSLMARETPPASGRQSRRAIVTLPRLDAHAQAALAQIPAMVSGQLQQIVPDDLLQMALDQLGDDLPVGQQSAPADWQQRFFGALADGEVDEQIALIERGLPGVRRAVEEAAGFAAALRQAAERGDGTAMRGVHRDLERLRARVAALDELATVETEIEACIAEERRLRRQQLDGSSSAGGEQPHLKAAISEHGERLAELSTRRVELRRTVGLRSEAERLRERLTQREERWPDIESRASLADQTDADRAEQQHGLLQHQLRALEVRMHYLRAELTLRAEMDVEDASRESAERAAYRMRTTDQRDGRSTVSHATGPGAAVRPSAASEGAGLGNAVG